MEKFNYRHYPVTKITQLFFLSFFIIKFCRFELKICYNFLDSFRENACLIKNNK